jgi:hypothetical protein
MKAQKKPRGQWKRYLGAFKTAEGMTVKVEVCSADDSEAPSPSIKLKYVRMGKKEWSELHKQLAPFRGRVQHLWFQQVDGKLQLAD